MGKKKQRLEKKPCDSKSTNNERASIDALNEDCLVHIIQFLPIADRFRVERVSKRWYEASQTAWRSFIKLDFKDKIWRGFKRGIRDSNIEKVLSRCSYLQSMKCHHFPMNVRLLRELSLYCKNITEISLKLTEAACSNNVFKTAFPLFKSLRRVEIDANYGFDGSSLQYLNTESIKEISLCNCADITYDILVIILEKLKNLHTLCLTNSLYSFTKSELSNSLSAMNVKQLDISDNDFAIDNDFLLKLTNIFRNLISLNVSENYRITDKGLAAIAKLPNFEELHVNYLKFSIEILCDMPNLKKLYGTHSNINDNDAIKLLCTSEKIEHLDLSFCKNISEHFVHSAVETMKLRNNSVKIVLLGTRVKMHDLPKTSSQLKCIL